MLKHRILRFHEFGGIHGKRVILKIYLNIEDFMAENVPIFYSVYLFGVTLGIKNLPANARDPRDVGLTPGSRRAPGGGNGHPLHFAWESDGQRSGLQSAGLQMRRTRLNTHTYICNLSVSKAT